MAVRKIYVRPGDRVVVHVVENSEFRLTNPEWEMHRPRPFSFSFVAERSGVTFCDPGLDVGLQQGAERRRQMTPNP